jgi:hypothetical protein
MDDMILEGSIQIIVNISKSHAFAFNIAFNDVLLEIVVSHSKLKFSASCDKGERGRTAYHYNSLLMRHAVTMK